MGFPLTADTAASIWRQHRANHLPQITQAITAAVPIGQILEGVIGLIVAQLIEEAPRAWAWLHDKIQAAGAAIDGKLTWENVKNDRLREWLEANDNPYDLFVAGIKALSAEVMAEVDTIKGDRLKQMWGAGRSPGFFTRSDRPMKDRPATSMVVRPSEDRALAQMVEAVQSLKEDHAALTAEVDALRAENETLRAQLPTGATLLPVDDDPEPTIPDLPPPVIDLDPSDFSEVEVVPEPAPEVEITPKPAAPITPATGARRGRTPRGGRR